MYAGLTSSRLSRQQRASIVPFNVHFRRDNLVIKAVYTSNVFVGKNSQREVYEQDQSDRGVEEIRQKGGLEAADDRVNDHW